jgi:hypothetical protein
MRGSSAEGRLSAGPMWLPVMGLYDVYTAQRATRVGWMILLSPAKADRRPKAVGSRVFSRGSSHGIFSSPTICMRFDFLFRGDSLYVHQHAPTFASFRYIVTPEGMLELVA